MKSNSLSSALPRSVMALGVAISCVPLHAQNTMAGNGSGSSNGPPYCPPGLNCDPCDTARNGTYIIKNPGPGPTFTGRMISPPPGTGATTGSGQSKSVLVGGPRLKLIPVPTWSALGGSPAKVTYCVAVSIQNVGNAPWQAPLNLKLVDIQGWEYPGEMPTSPGIPSGITLNQLPTHAPQNSLPIAAQVPIAPSATLNVQLLVPCVTIEWYKRPELVIQADDTKLSCPVRFGLPNPKRLNPSGTVQRPAAASSAMSKQ
jgi:hypothetical protein